MASKKSKSKKPIHPLQLFFILVVALSIPTTIIVLGQQQQTQSKAAVGGYYCAANAYGIHVTLGRGSKGECVKHLQRALNSHILWIKLPRPRWQLMGILVHRLKMQ